MILDNRTFIEFQKILNKVYQDIYDNIFIKDEHPRLVKFQAVQPNREIFGHIYSHIVSQIREINQR